MGYVNLPRLDTNVGGVTGHAHPSPLKPYQTGKSRILEAVTASVPLNVELRGLLTDDVKSAFELVMPKVRRSPLGHDAVQHLDVVSCWKGLQFSNATELVLWDRLFRESLTSHIKRHLLQAFATHLSRCQDPTNEAFLMPRMVDYLWLKQPGMMALSADDIVLNMISKYYDEFLTMPWSCRSHNLPEHLHKIVRTYDCFLHGAGRSRLLFGLTHTHSVVEGRLNVFADVDWQLPRVSFSALPVELPAGDIYRIMPHYGHKAGITYTITKSALPLEWDSKRDCFSAVVPCGNSSLVDTEISAKIVIPFDDGVSFERTSRYSLRLRVLKDSQPACTARDVSPPDEALKVDALVKDVKEALAAQGCSTLMGRSLPTRFRNRADSVVGDLLLQPYTIAVRGGKTEHAQTSPTKRKASRDTRFFPESEKTTLEYWKRQKVEELNDPDLHMDDHPPQSILWDSYATAHAHAARFGAESPASNFLAELGKDLWGGKRNTQPIVKVESPEHDVIVEVRLSPQDEPASIEPKDKHTAFPWQREDNYVRHSPTFPMDRPDPLHDRPRRHSYSSFPLIGTLISPVDSAIDNTISPVGTRSLDSSESDFDQAQIQRNYLEFEEHQKRKAAEKGYYAATIPGFDGIISPSDILANENDRSFYERVFLQDGSSADGASDIEAVSDDGEGRA